MARLTSERSSEAARRFVPGPAGAVPVAYFEAGNGPDLVLIHGALVNADDMRLGPMARLAESHRVVAFDRPGHGSSGRAGPGDASLWRQAELLRAAANRLGLRKPILAGHSYGGAVALAWAMSFPGEVSGVLAMAPICFPEPRLEQVVFGLRSSPLTRGWVAKAVHAVADPLVLPALWRAMFLPQAMPEEYAASFSFGLAGRSDQAVREGDDAALLWPDLTRSALAYRGCRVPVRFLCGDRDLVVNNYLHARSAARLIPGAELRWLPGIGHMLHQFRQDDVADEVRAVEAAAGRT